MKVAGRQAATHWSNPTKRLMKLITSAVIVTILGLQLWVMLPTGRHGGWYWPFVEYPMYAAAHGPADSVTTRRLKVSTCEPNATAVPVSDSLGIPLMRFQALLESVVSNRATVAMRDSSVSLLSEVIASSTRHRGCVAEIVTQSVPLATFDWTARAERWTPVFRWKLPATPRR